MTTPQRSGGRLPDPYGRGESANLADILERVLDKGVVIAGDIRVNLLDIELLTIKLRLVVASVDRAKEMGIDWWESDPALSSRARRGELTRENAELRHRLAELEELEGRGRDE
ncbi:gas vesicle protein [Actinomycetota bacterium Odt1-20B]